MFLAFDAEKRKALSFHAIQEASCLLVSLLIKCYVVEATSETA